MKLHKPKIHNSDNAKASFIRLCATLFIVNILLMAVHFIVVHKIIGLAFEDSLKHCMDWSNSYFYKMIAVINVLILCAYSFYVRYILFLIVVSVIFLEITLRILEPYFPSKYINVENVGVKHKPFHDSANSLGFNDKEYPKESEDGVTRIIALGDSFNWAGGYENNYWTLAEQYLNPSSDDSAIEILNQGTSMTGPDYLLRLLKQESIHFNPDVVILSFFVGNDFDQRRSGVFREVRLGYPLKMKSKKKLSLIKDSYLWFFIASNKKRLSDQWMRKKEIKEGKRVGYISRKKFLEIEAERMMIGKASYYTSEDWKATQDILREFNRYLAERNIAFWVVILPDEYQVVNSLQDEVFDQFRPMLREDYDFELPQKKLGAYLRHENINYLDLLPTFFQEAKEGKELYEWSDSHFNKAGNELAAKKVSEFIAKQLTSKS